MSYPPLGAQLIVFSGQTDLERDTVAVLDAVAQAGFHAIECGTTFHAEDPAALVALLSARGLKIAGVHGGVSFERDAVLRLMDAYSTRDLCISGVGGWNGTSAQDYVRDVATLNEAARSLAPEGVRLHYHNHAYEFATLDNGCSGMQVIIDNLDAAVADLCVDVAWVHIGGQDPATFLRQHRERVGYVHLKDYIGDRHWVELGQGIVPLPSVMAALAELPRVRWAVYEQDTSDHPAAQSTARSHRYLAETFGYD